MKRFTQSFTAIIFFFSIALLPVMAQEEVAVEKDEAVKKEETKTTVKKKTGVFTMGEIVVKDRSIASIEDASTTTEISSDDIKARSEKDIADTLTQVPGMSAELHAKGSKRFSMRGFDQEMVAVLVDGIPVFDPYEASIDISQIPVFSASKIVVSKGVSSALYGSNGVAGVINVVSMKPSELFAEATAEYGIGNDFNLTFANGAPLGKLYYMLSGSVMYSDGYNVSDKLDKSEREKWFNKLVKPSLYGVTVDSAASTMKSIDTYINGGDDWEHTSYRKYQVSGKVGYNITKDMEAGVNASYFYKIQRSSTFSAQSAFSDYDPEYREWENLNSDSFDDVETLPKSSPFQNRAFYWPGYYSFNVAPYFSWDKDNLSLRANMFAYRQVDNLRGYADVDHDTYLFPSSTYEWFIHPTKPGVEFAKPIFEESDSRWTNTTFGVNILPSYKLNSWNRLNASVSFRIDQHLEEEKAFDSSTGIIAVHGTDWYDKKYLADQMLTVALEDEIKPMKNLGISVGVSYDAQNLTDFRERKGGDVQAEINDYVDGYMAEDDATVWGTRDALSPVLGVVYEPMKDFLTLRASGSIKTKFPTLSNYADLYEGSGDTKIKPEKIYSANGGFEINIIESVLTLRSDYFYMEWKDKIDEAFDDEFGDSRYVNLDGVRTQGIEVTLSGNSPQIAGLVDISYSLSYVFNNTINLDETDDEEFYKGEDMSETPVHQFVFDVRANFSTMTTVSVFGWHTRNQFMYAMKSLPTEGDGVADSGDEVDYSTEYFEKVDLNNPFMLNIKVSQRFLGNYEAYVMCKNVLDDYAADPFNPGPGRQFLFGAKAEL